MSAFDRSRFKWEVVPGEGHRGLFSQEEVEQALQLLVSRDDAGAIADELYGDPNPGLGIFFPGDLLSALSLVSDDVARRVQMALRETPEHAARRVAQFRKHLGIS